MADRLYQAGQPPPLREMHVDNGLWKQAEARSGARLIGGVVAQDHLLAERRRSRAGPRDDQHAGRQAVA